MSGLQLSHSSALRTQWVGSRVLQKLQIIIINGQKPVPIAKGE